MNGIGKLKAVIFDMDGLLIDSEPLWQEAGRNLLGEYGKGLTNEMYAQTTGLRTKEWLQHWFDFFGLENADMASAEQRIISYVVEAARMRGEPMAGVSYILDLFAGRGVKIGLATSSPMQLAEVVVEKLGIGGRLAAMTSAEYLPFGKPHPEVYLKCAASLGIDPRYILCFEDSFNGLIAAKAAKMKCVVVPAPEFFESPVWGAADKKLASLELCDGTLLQEIFS